jgi:hypothetical protein
MTCKTLNIECDTIFKKILELCDSTDEDKFINEQQSKIYTKKKIPAEITLTTNSAVLYLITVLIAYAACTAEKLSNSISHDYTEQ